MSKSLTSALFLTSAVVLSLISACGKNDPGQQNKLSAAQPKALIEVPQSLFGKYGKTIVLTKYAACATEIEISPYFDTKSQQNYLTSLATNPDKEDGHIGGHLYINLNQLTNEHIDDKFGIKNVTVIEATQSANGIFTIKKVRTTSVLKKTLFKKTWKVDAVNTDALTYNAVKNEVIVNRTWTNLNDQFEIPGGCKFTKI